MTKQLLSTLSTLSVLLALVNCAFNPNPHSRTPSSQKLGPDVTPILIWNTYKGHRDGFEREAQKLIESHDIVLFQEVIFNDFFRDLMRDGSRLKLEEAVSWGRNGVATSASQTSHETLALKTKVREFGLLTKKASLFTTYKMTTPSGAERDLLVLNVHMINFRTSWGFQKNLEQYRQKLEQHEGPVLAAGDFNTWSKNRRELVREFFREFGLEEVQFGWHGHEDPRQKAIFGVLDRAFTKGLDIHWSYVYNDIQSSDHQPFALGVTATP